MNKETKQQTEKWLFFMNGEQGYTIEDGNGKQVCTLFGLETTKRISNLPVVEAENQQLKDINRELLTALEKIRCDIKILEEPREEVTKTAEKAIKQAVARTAGERVEK